MIGKTISHYEIVDKLGQGGMGVVYKARDLRLSRHVAIKMISPEFASDETRKKRLLREAQAASKLNHPNICTIHEIDEVDGVMFVVMELVGGHTLAEEICAGGMDRDQMVSIAIDIADALDKAHRAGVIHRDIKPSNILITQEGGVKVVDFGLARMVTPVERGDMSHAATIQEALTEQGEAVGTIYYMAPEQIRSGTVDARSDIFSFGVVLYAMATGKLPFQGKSAFEIMSAILLENPPTLTARDLSGDFSRIVSKALAKNPEERYSSMNGLISDLRAVQKSSNTRGIKAQTRPAGLTQMPAPPTVLSRTTERRPVTVVVSRLIPYTELIENLSSSEAQSFLGRIRELAEEIVAQHGGIINQFTGDEIVILCGIPTAHEDDSLRAVRAVREFHALVKELSPQVEERIGQRVCLQSGIGAGTVVAEFLSHSSEAKYRLTGNVTRLAAQLAGHANVDEVLISPECRHVISPYFDTEASDPIILRSKDPAMTPFRVLGESGLQTRLQAAEKSGFTSFTGREKELRTLENRFELACRGEGQLVTVVGEAGIGKSRLGFEFRNTLDPDSTLVLEGRCHSHRSNVAYAPLVEGLRDLLQLQENDHSNTEELAVDRICAIDPSLEEFIPIYLQLLSVKTGRHSLPRHLQGENLRVAIQEAFSAILTLASRTSPIVLFLEDWHWADDASQEVLAHLAGMVSGFRILLIVAHRPEARLSIGILSNHTTIHLNPFDTSLSMHALKSIFGVSEVPENVTRLVYDRTGGNPFFIEELSHSLREEGSIRIAEDRASLVSAMDQIRLPETIEAVIRTRLDRLGPEDQEVVRVSSVIGRAFNRGILQRVMGDNVAILQPLDNLKDLGIVQQIAVLPEAVYRFNHVLTQEVAYQSLLHHRRRELHGSAGRAMEDQYSNRVEEYADVLSHHFTQAEEWEKAIGYGRISARQAAKLGQFVEAFNLGEKIHSLILELPEGEHRRNLLTEGLLDQERICETLGRRDRQQQLIDELRSITLAADDQIRLADVERRQGDLYTLMDQFDKAEEALWKSLRISADLSDAGARRNALSSLGFLRWKQGKEKESAEINEQVLAMDRTAGELQSVAGDLTNLGNVLRHLGEHQRALQCLEEALQIYDQESDPVKQVYAMHIVGIIHRDFGDIDRALEYLNRALDVSIKNQLFFAQGFHLNALANVYWQLDNLERSLELQREALVLNRRIGNAGGLALSLRIVGEVLLAQGKSGEALPYFLEGADLFAQLGDRELEAKTRSNAADVLEREREFPKALAHLSRVRDLKRLAHDDAAELEALENMVRVNKLGGGDPQLSLLRYREALALARKKNDEAKTAGLLNSIGILEWNRGEYQKALDCYQEAQKIFEKLRDEVHVGFMLNSVGATLTQLFRFEEARSCLERAVELNAQTKEALLEGHGWAALGEVWYKMDNREKALDCYQTSLAIRRRINDRRGEGWMLLQIARLQRLQGARTEADDSLAQAAKIAIECTDEKLKEACGSLRIPSQGGNRA